MKVTTAATARRRHGRPTLVIAPYRERKPVEELFAAERGGLVLHRDPDEPTDEECEDA